MRVLKILLVCLGGGIFYYVLQHLGVALILGNILLLRWKLALPILLFFPSYLVYAYGWKLCLTAFDHVSVSFLTLVRIKMAGEAANALTPVNFAGGDPLRVWMLSGKVPVPEGGASVVVERTLHVMAIVLVVFFGNLVAVIRLNLPVWVRVFLSVTGVLLLFLIGLSIFFQKRGLFEGLLNLAGYFKLRTVSVVVRKKVREMDQNIGVFYKKHKGRFYLVLGLELAGRSVHVVEIYLVGRFLSVPMGFEEAIFFAGVIPLTNFLGALIPGALGIMEGVLGSLFYAMNWNPADGVSLQLVRRLRSFFWILVGMGFVMMTPVGKKKKPDASSG